MQDGKKLTVAQVVAIKTCLALGATQVGLAQAFGVHQTTISDIKTGVLWKGVKV